jgi:hypothetical protein
MNVRNFRFDVVILNVSFSRRDRQKMGLSCQGPPQATYVIGRRELEGHGAGVLVSHFSTFSP